MADEIIIAKEPNQPRRPDTASHVKTFMGGAGAAALFTSLYYFNSYIDRLQRPLEIKLDNVAESIKRIEESQNEFLRKFETKVATADALHEDTKIRLSRLELLLDTRPNNKKAKGEN